MGGGQHQLSDIEKRFAERSLVCAYDRAGVGASDPPTKTPRPVSELVADLDAFATAADARPPYLLVGQSMGANVVFMYTQAHPEKVAGFVAMNPVPPEETFLPAVKKVETKAEFAEELSFNRGENDENTSFHEPMLSNPLPASMPYTVMFDEDCGGDGDFCSRILPPLIRTTKSWPQPATAAGSYAPRARARHLLGRPRARPSDDQRRPERRKVSGERAVVVAFHCVERRMKLGEHSIALILAIGSLALVATACGGSDDDSAETIVDRTQAADHESESGAPQRAAPPGLIAYMTDRTGGRASGSSARRLRRSPNRHGSPRRASASRLVTGREASSVHAAGQEGHPLRGRRFR